MKYKVSLCLILTYQYLALTINFNMLPPYKFITIAKCQKLRDRLTENVFARQQVLLQKKIINMQHHVC